MLVNVQRVQSIPHGALMYIEHDTTSSVWFVLEELITEEGAHALEQVLNTPLASYSVPRDEQMPADLPGPGEGETAPRRRAM